MTEQTRPFSQAQREQTENMLLELHVPIHRVGFEQLCIAIPCFARDPAQSLSKELYPQVAEHFGNADWRSVERAIREAIYYAWNHGDPAVWEAYFPGQLTAPSNRLFIITLSRRL